MNTTTKTLKNIIDQYYQLFPNDVKLLFSLGKTLLKLTKYSEALNCFESVIKLDNKYLRAYKKKIIVLKELSCLKRIDYFQEINDIYDHIIKLEPLNAKNFWEKANYLSFKGCASEAILFFKEAKRLEPNNENYSIWPIKKDIDYQDSDIPKLGTDIKTKLLTIEDYFDLTIDNFIAAKELFSKNIYSYFSAGYLLGLSLELFMKGCCRHLNSSLAEKELTTHNLNTLWGLLKKSHHNSKFELSREAKLYLKYFIGYNNNFKDLRYEVLDTGTSDIIKWHKIVRELLDNTCYRLENLFSTKYINRLKNSHERKSNITRWTHYKLVEKRMQDNLYRLVRKHDLH